jgi:hypothetical protein
MKGSLELQTYICLHSTCSYTEELLIIETPTAIS